MRQPDPQATYWQHYYYAPTKAGHCWCSRVWMAFRSRSTAQSTVTNAKRNAHPSRCPGAQSVAILSPPKDAVSAAHPGAGCSLHWAPATRCTFSSRSTSSAYQPKRLQLHLLPGSSFCVIPVTLTICCLNLGRGINNVPSPNGILASRESSMSWELLSPLKATF